VVEWCGKECALSQRDRVCRVAVSSQNILGVILPEMVHSGVYFPGLPWIWISMDKSMDISMDISMCGYQT